MFRNRNLPRLLNCLGLLGILVGFVIAFYSIFFLGPKFKDVFSDIDHGIATLESTTTTLKNNTPLILNTLNSIQAGTQIADLLPQTLTSLRGAVVESAELLKASSATARQLNKGVSGLVLPDEGFTATGILMRNTAFQLQLLGKMLNQIQIASTQFSAGTSQISQGINQLGISYTSLTQDLTQSRENLRRSRDSLHRLAIPTQVTMFGFGISGIYIGLGLIFLTLAKIYSVLESLRNSADSEKPSIVTLHKAA